MTKRTFCPTCGGPWPSFTPTRPGNIPNGAASANGHIARKAPPRKGKPILNFSPEGRAAASEIVKGLKK